MTKRKMLNVLYRERGKRWVGGIEDEVRHMTAAFRRE